MAVVKEASADTFFMTYLDEVEKSSPDLLKAEEMSEKEALEALQDKKVEGIYYVGKRAFPYSSRNRNRRKYPSDSSRQL